MAGMCNFFPSAGLISHLTYRSEEKMLFSFTLHGSRSIVETTLNSSRHIIIIDEYTNLAQTLLY
jgi:hypothetical protein